MGLIDGLSKILQLIDDFTRPYGNLSDSELEKQREETRLRGCSGENVYEELRKFDDEIQLREMRSDLKEEDGNLPHSQHGWYLSEDDD